MSGTDEPAGVTGGEIVYRYLSETWEPLFEVVRRNDADGKKRFFQRPMGGKPVEGQRAMAGVRLVLYRLPEVIDAVAMGQAVYVVEGEKDADALWSRGIPATTNPMGAGKWRDEYSEFLRGADVVVVRDRDEPGHKHAQAVAQSLRAVAASVQVVEAAEGKDTSDHLEAGLGVADFVEVGHQLELVESKPTTTTKARKATDSRNSDDEFELFRARIEGATEGPGGEWSGHCPAHDDRNPSLTFRRGDNGKLVVHCHAGCGFEDIMRAAELWRDMKTRGRSPAPENETDDKPDVWPPPNDPMAVARAIVERHHRTGGTVTLRRWRDSWFRWDPAGCWSEDEQAAIRSGAYHDLEAAHYWKTNQAVRDLVPWQPNRNKVADVLEALAAVTALPKAIDPPTWLDGASGPPPGEIVACANGLLHVATKELMPHDPRFFNRVAVPFDYDADALEPAMWLDFLGQLWPDDSDSVAALQQWFGYVLSGRTDHHKILLMVGPTRSGKGTIARVLSRLVGESNRAAPTLASLRTNFGLQPLIGKPLAVVSDARLGEGDTAAVVERLLSVSGEDAITIDIKYKEQWTGKLPARFVILSNELPQFGDASGAIANRFVVLTLTESWLGREDTTLTDKLFGELPGILRWSLDGLDQLAKGGRFTEPQSSADARTMLQDIGSPVSAFVRDCCTRSGAHEIAADELYRQYRFWCERNGARAEAKQIFGRDLRSVAPEVRRRQRGSSRKGDRGWVYEGIGLRDELPGVS